MHEKTLPENETNTRRVKVRMEGVKSCLGDIIWVPGSLDFPLSFAVNLKLLCTLRSIKTNNCLHWVWASWPDWLTGNIFYLIVIFLNMFGSGIGGSILHQIQYGIPISIWTEWLAWNFQKRNVHWSLIGPLALSHFHSLNESVCMHPQLPVEKLSSLWILNKLGFTFVVMLRKSPSIQG